MYYKSKLQQIDKVESDQDFLLEDGQCFRLLDKKQIDDESVLKSVEPCSLSNSGLSEFDVCFPLTASHEDLLKMFNSEIAIKSLESEDVTQVGGCHYKSQYQVVDYVMKHSLDFIQGNILKYATRFRKKNGGEDLKKALHYCKLSRKYVGDDVLFTNSTFDREDALRFISINNAEYSDRFLFDLCRRDFVKCQAEIERLLTTI